VGALSQDSAMIKVTQLKPLRGYRLHATFSDGTAGEHDFSTPVAESGPMVEPLRDPAYFASHFWKMARRLGRTVSICVRIGCAGRSRSWRSSMALAASAIHFPFEPGKTHTIGELRDFERKLSFARQSDDDLSKAWRVPATEEMKRWCKIREEIYPIKLLAEHRQYSDDVRFRLMSYGHPTIDAEITSATESFNIQITIADPSWTGEDGLAKNGGYDHRLVMEELNKAGMVIGSASMRRENGKIVSGLPVKSFEQEFGGCRQGLVTALQRKLGRGVKGCRLLIHARRYDLHTMDFSFEEVAKSAIELLKSEISKSAFEAY
jgi:hypothetical protein